MFVFGKSLTGELYVHILNKLKLLITTGRLQKSVNSTDLVLDPNAFVEREARRRAPTLDRGLCFECSTQRSRRTEAGAGAHEPSGRAA